MSTSRLPFLLSVSILFTVFNYVILIDSGIVHLSSIRMSFLLPLAFLDCVLLGCFYYALEARVYTRALQTLLMDLIAFSGSITFLFFCLHNCSIGTSEPEWMLFLILLFCLSLPVHAHDLIVSAKKITNERTLRS